jgi:aldehyde dehydrogenase (NAD+)
LVAGNSVVLKPSPFTPLTTLKIGEIAQGILPPGVLNVVSGGDELGPWMSAHPGIAKISFTGSTATGRKVMASAATNLKRLTLELGGNDAAIVLPDVDLDKVVPELFWAAFRNTGQVCVAAKRMYVHETIYDEFARRLSAYAATVQLGDGSQQGVQLGPIQNAVQFARVRDLIQSAREEGLDFLTGGKPAENGQGYFVPVTIIGNPPETSRVVTEEAFGPVLPLLRFSDNDEVVRRANDSEYGLGGSVWSGDPEKARALGERLRCGTVWINEIQHLTPFAAFAGHGQSGIGVENGVDGLLEYTNVQTISMRRNALPSG